MDPLEIHSKIHKIRGAKVMLDYDLATLYKVETRKLKQAVKRNRNRFPQDFMLELNNADVLFMVSQKVIPSRSKLGGSLPYAFTEHGIAMLSSILKSKKALEINIHIIRAFIEISRVMKDENAFI